jgi:hypothetical protein
MKKLWPSWRYRRLPDGGIESRIFTGPGEITGEGWEDSPALLSEVKAASNIEEKNDGEETDGRTRPEGQHPEPEDAQRGEGREDGPGDGETGEQVLNFEGLSKEALIDIADKAGVKIDRRWGRSRIEDALRSA